MVTESADSIDSAQIEAFESAMGVHDWQIVGKLLDKQVADLRGAELHRAFADVGSPRYCHRVVRELMQRGLTIEMLGALDKRESTADGATE